MQEQGALRAEMAMQLSAAQAGIEAQIAELERSANAVPASVMAELRGQLNGLSALQGSVSSASPMMLQSLREQVTSSVAIANSALSQAREASIAAERVQATRLETIAEINRRTRDTITSIADDLYEKRIFDPYLSFKSPQEEAAYREREAENKQYIQEQLEKNTTVGNLNATAAMADQLIDANRNGAGKSPEFAERWKRTREAYVEQHAAAKAEGEPTKEAEQRLANTVRNVLREEGLSEAVINSKMEAASDPLEVIEDHMEGVKEAPPRQVARAAVPQKPAPAAAPTVTPAPAELAAEPAVEAATAAPAAPEEKASPAPVLGDSKLMAELGALAAALKGSGVALTDPCKSEGHGLAANCAAPAAGRGI